MNKSLFAIYQFIDNSYTPTRNLPTTESDGFSVFCFQPPAVPHSLKTRTIYIPTNSPCYTFCSSKASHQPWRIIPPINYSKSLFTPSLRITELPPGNYNITIILYIYPKIFFEFFYGLIILFSYFWNEYYK